MCTFSPSFFPYTTVPTIYSPTIYTYTDPTIYNYTYHQIIATYAVIIYPPT